MLEIENLSVRYGDGVEALHDISVAVAEGTATAIIGGNGAGKSTILRAASGVLPFHKGAVVGGQVLFQGNDLTKLSPSAIVALGLVHVPEGRRIFAEMSVIENLRAGAAEVRSPKARAAKLNEVLEMFPILADRRNQRGALLSGGEQQLLAIGRGLMSSPKVILLDEPTLGLSPQMVERIAQTIEHVLSSGVTVVLVEQNAAMALRVAEYGNVVERGRVVLCDRAEVLAGSADVQALFLGGEVSDEPVVPVAPRRLRKWVA